MFVNDAMILLSANFRKILSDHLAKLFGFSGDGKEGEQRWEKQM